MGIRGWRARRAQRTAETLRKGEIIRQLHWQCWREDAPPLETPLADLVAVLPVLIESGSVGLVWPRLWHRAEELGAVGAALAAAYESQVAHNAKVERDIARVVTRLREHGVEPVLIKGMAVASLYPASLVRPAGDIDLVVRDDDYATAKAALADLHLSFHGDPASWSVHAASTVMRKTTEPAERTLDVDLHSVSNWYGAVDERFVTEAERVTVGGADVRVPRVEDHLRALCLHFLWHGGVRPMRLCDIALLLETGTGSRSLNRFQPGTVAAREPVPVASQLAETLLGADIDDSSGEAPDFALPPWVVEMVTRRWGERPRPFPHRQDVLRGPLAAWRMLASRWPDPISAVVQSRSSFGSKPSLRAAGAVFVNHRKTTLASEFYTYLGHVNTAATRLRALRSPWREH